MKAKITKPDGTVIELEGDAEEIRKTLDPSPVPAYAPFVPYEHSGPIWIDPYCIPNPPWTVDSTCKFGCRCDKHFKIGDVTMPDPLTGTTTDLTIYGEQ